MDLIRLQFFGWRAIWPTGNKDGSYSDDKPISCDVPQWSCLGPLLYAVFTNELPLIMYRAKVSIYADDTTVYMAEPTTEELERVLNRELQSVVDWITNNKLVLNVSKTKSIEFGTNHCLRKEPRLKLYVNDAAVEQVQEIKLLGITMDSKLS